VTSQRRRQLGPPERWYPTTSLSDVTNPVKLEAARSSKTLVSYHDHYMASQPGRPELESLPLLKCQILQQADSHPVDPPLS